METNDPLQELDGVELVQLAMLAFIHMDKEEIIPKRELLDQILLWFDAMTDDVIQKEAHEIQPSTETLQ